jgi:RimJ/RimL family protein N-acetyltransferase
VARITFAALAEAHIPAIVAACANWQELAPSGSPYWRPRSEAELRRKATATAGPVPATDYTFVLCDGDRLVAECSVHSIDWRNRVASIGICVWRLEDRRSGYGVAGVAFLIDWAFGQLGLARLEAWVNEGNEASLALFTRLGFTHEAMLRQRYFWDGKWLNVHVLALLNPSSH